MLLSGLSLFFIICAIEEVNENGKTCTCTKCSSSMYQMYMCIFLYMDLKEDVARKQFGYREAQRLKMGKIVFLQICGTRCFQMVDFEMNSGGGGGG